MTLSTKNQKPEIDWVIFTPALIIVLLGSLSLTLFPASIEQFIADTRKSVMDHTLWLYLSVGIAALAFSLWLALGRYGNVKLGAPKEAPEYSDIHWVAMMFTAAIGASVIAWGFAEPIYYLKTPPLGIEVGTSESFEWAHMYPLSSPWRCMMVFSMKKERVTRFFRPFWKMVKADYCWLHPGKF